VKCSNEIFEGVRKCLAWERKGGDKGRDKEMEA